MRQDSRLSGVLHVLLHMAEVNGPVTSEALARAMHTNPVVIRRIMAGLRDQDFLRSDKGHGGGWRIACDFETLTLLDVYKALGAPALLAMGNRTEAPNCLVEQAVNAAMNDALFAAEAVLLTRFGQVTLAALSADFHARSKQRGNHCAFEKADASEGNKMASDARC
ncbi:MAG: Rrf2 family transcriptional regulator [Phyllobacterium sp.]|uniref:Rrf2 family transcriptional regulator n=1 Tax=Phyllobacterium sp. TaxID=1871046 RepID=UPI0030F0CD04